MVAYWTSGNGGKGGTSGPIGRSGFFGVVFAIVLLLAILVCPGRAFALYNYQGPVDTSWYSEGADHFEISRPDQLAGVARLGIEDGVSFAGKTITLANDIDISGYEWEPIGGSYGNETAFAGTFDGAGHAVNGLTIDNTESYQALFGNVKGATIKDLTVSGTVRCATNAAGIIAQASRSKLSNLTNRVNVTALGNVAYWDETISYNGTCAGVVCYALTLEPDETFTYTGLTNYGEILGTGPSGCAGVVGSLTAVEHSTFVLKNCVNHGNVYLSKAQNVDDLTDGVGGVLGSTAEMGTYKIIGCVNTGSITSNNLGSVGGVAGSVQGVGSVIDHSSNTGTVTNMGNEFDAPGLETPSAGGLVSQFESEGGRVTNNYSAGVVSSSSGFSAAIIGASTGDMTEIASNNFYLEGTSTGAFNNWETGRSHDEVMSGSAVTQEKLDTLIDSANGGVVDLFMQDPNVVEIDSVEKEPMAEMDLADDSMVASVLFAAVTLGLLLAGAVYEWFAFRRGRLAPQ